MTVALPGDLRIVVQIRRKKRLPEPGRGFPDETPGPSAVRSKPPRALRHKSTSNTPHDSTPVPSWEAGNRLFCRVRPRLVGCPDVRAACVV